MNEWRSGWKVGPRHGAPVRSVVWPTIFTTRLQPPEARHERQMKLPHRIERAVETGIGRWPDATEIDAMDMTADEAEAPEADAMPKDGDDDPKQAGEKDEQAPAMMADEDNDEGGNWSVSVLFVCDGKKFEALTDDEGKIHGLITLEDILEDQLELTDEFKAKLAQSEKEMSAGLRPRVR